MPRGKILRALELIRGSLAYPGMPRRELAKLGSMVAEICEKCRPKTMKGEKPEIVEDHAISRSAIDSILRARVKLIDSIELASPLETVDIFDQVVALSYAAEKLRFVSSRISKAAYRADEELRMDPDYYKGRFMIALYQGDELIDVFDNAREMAEKTGIPEKTVSNGLSYAFYGRRNGLVINGKRCRVFFVSAFG